MVCLSVILLWYRITCSWFCNKRFYNKKGFFLNYKGSLFVSDPVIGRTKLYYQDSSCKGVWEISFLSFQPLYNISRGHPKEGENRCWELADNAQLKSQVKSSCRYKWRETRKNWPNYQNEGSSAPTDQLRQVPTVQSSVFARLLILLSQAQVTLNDKRLGTHRRIRHPRAVVTKSHLPVTILDSQNVKDRNCKYVE